MRGLAALLSVLALGACAEQGHYMKHGERSAAEPSRTFASADPAPSGGADDPEPVVTTSAPARQSPPPHSPSHSWEAIDDDQATRAPTTDTPVHEPPPIDAWLRESELPIYIGQPHEAAVKACRAAGGRTLPIRRGSTGCIEVRFPIFDPSGGFGDAPVPHRLEWSQRKGKVTGILLDVDFADVVLKASDRVRAMMMTLEDVYLPSLAATYGTPDFGDTSVGYFGWDMGAAARVVAGADYRNRFMYVQFGLIDGYEDLKRQVEEAAARQLRPPQ